MVSFLPDHSIDSLEMSADSFNKAHTEAKKVQAGRPTYYRLHRENLDYYESSLPDSRKKECCSWLSQMNGQLKLKRFPEVEGEPT